MYEEVRPQLYKFLVDIAESTYPSGPFKKIKMCIRDRSASAPASSGARPPRWRCSLP